MIKTVIESAYPEFRFFGFTRRDLITHFLLRVHALLQAGDVVLDVGCGRGIRTEDECRFRREFHNFKDQGRHVIGIDVDPNAASNPLLHEFRQINDTSHWPVEDASVNLIHSVYVLEHVDDPGQFFSEAFRG